MNSALGIVIGLAVLSCIFWILGTGFCSLMGRKEEPGFLWLLGLAVFLGMFSVVDILMEACGAAFHVLFYAALVMHVLVIAVCVYYLVRSGKRAGRALIQYPACDVWLLLFVILLIVQIRYGMGNQLYVSRYDTSYYNGNAINALYTDTMYQYDAYTGVYVGKAVAWHDSYSMLIAFLAKLFFMHPLVVVNRIMGVIEIMAANLAVYEIALRLSKGNRAVAVWAAIIRALISVLCWNLGEVPGYYLWTRMAESKSMLANVYLPLALLAIVLASEETEKKQCWIMLGVFAFAGATMSMSGVFMIPMLLGVGLLPVLLRRKKLKYWGYAVLSVLPCLAAGVLSFL